MTYRLRNVLAFTVASVGIAFGIAAAAPDHANANPDGAHVVVPVQLTCFPDGERALGNLRREFGEVPVAGGVSPNGDAVLVVMASPDARTFTIAAIYPDGTVCGIAHGTDWEVRDTLVGDPA